ncbi:MAG: PIG-L family deacetylase [Propionibacteriaceae bacterium]|jgi:N-acetyl-1-D-myo-inositol-2-amino-2-deoxy-alpha-D-glucopyranoside deacetylase|nr:PIG-L family deacetylase [Propionibacteriaceae bacterium]
MTDRLVSSQPPTVQPETGRRYLFVHAHPDDETLSSGAIIVALRRQGHTPLVLTATRGELGEVTPAVAQQLGMTAATDTVAASAALVAYRLAERQQALRWLGAIDAGWLGTSPNRASGSPDRRYSDSGMTWLAPGLAGPAPDAPDSALTQAPLATVVADLIAAAQAWRAEVIVSYDAAGGYGHPDHQRCHQAAEQAARRLALPFAVLVTEPTEIDQLPTDQVFQAGPDQERLLAAHRAYRSQFTVAADGVSLTHVGGQVEPIAQRLGWRFSLVDCRLGVVVSIRGGRW